MEGLIGLAGVLLATGGVMACIFGQSGDGVPCVLLGGAMIGFVVWKRSQRKPGDVKKSTIFGDAHFCSAKEVRELGLVRASGIPLGYLPDDPPASAMLQLRYGGDQHIVTVAPSRTGKGTTAILPTLLEHDASALVIDPKGQNAAVSARRRRDMGHDVVLLNPFKLHAEHFAALGFKPSHKVNPLAALDKDSDSFVADVSSICEALIISGERDPHWGDAARNLISALIMYLVVSEPATASLGRMRKLLTQPVGEGTTDDLSPEPGTLRYTMQMASECGYPPAEQRAGRFVGNVDREYQSVLSTALTQTAFLDDPAIAESLDGDEFRFADLKSSAVTIYLILPSRYLAAYRRWLRLMVVCGLDALTSSPGRQAKPVLLVLDEFAQLGHLSAVENAMGLAAGFGVQIWPIVQDINQLRNMYRERWETFLANAGILQVFRPNDMSTAEYFSKRTGTLTAYAENISEQEISRQQSQGGFTGISRSYAPQMKPLMTPIQFIGVHNDLEIIFVSGSEFPVMARREPYYKLAAYAGMYDADPYHAPPSPAPAIPQRRPIASVAAPVAPAPPRPEPAMTQAAPASPAPAAPIADLPPEPVTAAAQPPAPIPGPANDLEELPDPHMGLEPVAMAVLPASTPGPAAEPVPVAAVAVQEPEPVQPPAPAPIAAPVATPIATIAETPAAAAAAAPKTQLVPDMDDLPMPFMGYTAMTMTVGPLAKPEDKKSG